jgi:hypothetical protein
MKDKKWYEKAYKWLDDNGLTPLHKRFWAVVIVGYGLAKQDAGLAGVGLAAFGAGTYDAHKKKTDKELSQKYERARNHGQSN